MHSVLNFRNLTSATANRSDGCGLTLVEARVLLSRGVSFPASISVQSPTMYHTQRSCNNGRTQRRPLWSFWIGNLLVSSLFLQAQAMLPSMVARTDISQQPEQWYQSGPLMDFASHVGELGDPWDPSRLSSNHSTRLLGPGEALPNVPDYEIEALWDLYQTAGGRNWTWYNHSLPNSLHTGIPWDFTAPAPNPCHPQRWQGLICSEDAVNYTTHIVAVELFVHNLRGSLPATFFNLTELLHINLADNRLTGTLSPAVVQLQRLQTFNVKINGLTGTVPVEIGLLPGLMVLDLHKNGFSGTIPTSIFAAQQLQFVNFGDNFMTGTLSDQIGSLQNLTTIDVSRNLLHGTVPAIIGNLTFLLELLLYENQFTGTIPVSFGQIHSLQSLEINLNLLTGTIPKIFTDLQDLTILFLSENNLHGTIPDNLGSLVSLESFYGYKNALSGSIPQSISSLARVATILLQENAITGSLSGLFSAAWQPQLSLLQLDSNQLTGTIPDELFALPALKTVVLGSNCFSGSLPLSACASPVLSTLSLDGLRTASSCQRVMLPGLSTAYVLTDKIHGGVPSCLFHKPGLVTLHLSGNGLTGTLPDALNISENLMDIVLSHNKLTGTIPHAFQRRVWFNLDLAYNRLSGTLGGELATVPGNYTFSDRIVKLNQTLTLEVTAATLSLRNNRLSSVVPSTVVDMHNISILAGNLFDCQLDKNDLPSRDSAIDTYQCGSASFDISYYIWLGCSAVVAAAAGLVRYRRRWFESAIGERFVAHSSIARWLSVEEGDGKGRLRHYQYVHSVCAMVATVALWSTLYIVVVFLPLYAVLSHLRATHTYTYAYTVSAAFLSGGVAAGLMLAFFLVLITALTALLKKLAGDVVALSGGSSACTLSMSDTTAAEREVLPGHKRVAIYAMFFLINVTVMIGANVAYLYVVLYEDSAYNTPAQISLSIFKLLWNNFGAQCLIRWTRRQVTSTTEEDRGRGAGLFAIQLFVALFNYIAIPCLVVGVVNPDCFNNLLVKAPTVNTSFFYEKCKVLAGNGGCALYLPDEGSSSYSPPFTYSYECSSSLITYYAPSFVYMALIVTFVNPALKLALLWAYQSRAKGSRLARLLEQYAPKVLQAIATAEHSGEGNANIAQYRLFDANKLFITLLTYLSVLLTFGLVFPPIAVAMLVSIYAVALTSQVEVGRFLTHAMEKGQYQYVGLVEREYLGVASVPKLRQAAMMLLTATCFFYAPFLFDTLGDSVGAAKAAWVVVLLIVLPLALYASVLLRGANGLSSRRPGDDESGIVGASVELPEVPKGSTITADATTVPSTDARDAQVVNILHSSV